MDSLKNNNASKTSNLILDNPVGFKILLLLGMIYMSLMICNAILTDRYVGTNSFYILGGTLTSPFIFILDDIVAEIYGYKITRFMIFSGFLTQIFFSVICLLVVNAEYPSFFLEEHAYKYILGISLLKIDLSGFVAYITANLANSYLITKWKILLKGRHFWLRSLGTSMFSEALYSFIAISLMEINRVPLHGIAKVIITSYLIKATYSVIFAWPGQLIVSYIKKRANIDVYDLPQKFTPFKFLKTG